MNGNQNRQEQENTDDKLHISKSIFQVSKEQRQKAEQEEQLKQAERERILAEKHRREQEEHDKRLEAERLELIRLKQGIIETIHEEHEEIAERTFSQKIGDFFYFNKWWLGIATVFAVIVIALIINIATKPRPDLIVLVIGENYALGAESQLAEYVETFTDTGSEKKDYASGAGTNLTTELNSANGVILIGNELAGKTLFDDSLVDLSELYPDNKYINKQKFMLSETDFAEKTGLQKNQISDDWFLSIRRPKKLLYDDLDEMQEVYDKDFAVFDSIIKDLSGTE